MEKEANDFSRWLNPTGPTLRSSRARGSTRANEPIADGARPCAVHGLSRAAAAALGRGKGARSTRWRSVQHLLSAERGCLGGCGVSVRHGGGQLSHAMLRGLGLEPGGAGPGGLLGARDAFLSSHHGATS
eukprot:g11166.t1